MVKSGCGFVYVATGEGYRQEASRSLASLKRCEPNYRVCLVTDRPPEEDSLFDDVVVLPPEQICFAPIDKLLAVHCPYERAVFLDTDTWIVGELNDLFDILDRFEMALLPETKRGWYYDLPGVPRSFAEFNTGVIVFQNSGRIQALFDRWRQLYWTMRQESQIPGLAGDQASFRSVLFHSDVRVAPIPSEYHFLGNTENYIMWDAKLIHARGDLPQIAARVNRTMGSRVYIPDVGTLQGFHGRRVWFNRLMRFFLDGLRLVWAKPVDSAQMNPGKWWLGEQRRANQPDLVTTSRPQ